MGKRLRDVAESAGCSLAVASRILNSSDKGNIRFSDELAEKVRRIAVEMGYMKPPGAASRRGTIAVVAQKFSLNYNDFPSSVFMQNLVFNLSEEGYDFTYIPREAEDINERIKALYESEKRICGLIVLHYSYLCSFLDYVKKRDVPYIFVNSGEVLGNNCIFPDDKGGCFQMVKFLQSCGHKKISYINYKTSHISGKTRSEAIQKYCPENGIEIIDHLEYPALTPDILKKSIEKGTQSFLLYLGDHRLRIFMEMLEGLGFKIPDDVGVATVSAMNNLGMNFSVLQTYVPFKEMADATASSFKNMMRSGNLTFNNIILPEYLIMGDSCRAFS